jgi:hypothetical protein
VTVAQSLSPQLFGGENHVASGSLRPGESKHNKEGSWDVIEELDLFPRSVRSGSKVPVARSQGSFPDTTSRAGGWSGASAMQWIIGGLQVEMRGHGGREGGELRIGGDGTVSHRQSQYRVQLMSRLAISFTPYHQFQTQDRGDLQCLNSPPGRFLILESSTPPSSTDRTSYLFAYEVSPNPPRHPLLQMANPMDTHVNLDLKHPLVYLGYSASEQGVRRSLVEDPSTSPVLRLYHPSTPPEIPTTSAQSLPPTTVSLKQQVKRLTERYSSVSDPRKNKTIGTISSEVLLVHDNQVQAGVIVVCHYQSLILMKLEQDTGGLVLILLRPCIPMIDLRGRVLECRTVRLGTLQAWIRGV